MIDKEYLDKLKEEDYIAYDNLVNDPIITRGTDDSLFGCGMFSIIIGLIVLGIVIGKYLL